MGMNCAKKMTAILLRDSTANGARQAAPHRTATTLGTVKAFGTAPDRDSVAAAIAE